MVLFLTLREYLTPSNTGQMNGWLKRNKVKILLATACILLYQAVIFEVVKLLSPNVEYLISGKSVYLVESTKETKCLNKSVRLSSRMFPLTALASFQGSGSIYLRHLVQQATGIATGSLYKAGKIRLELFPDLEVGDGIKDNRVLLIDTHLPLSKIPQTFKVPFERAILLIRNPHDTIKSRYIYKKTNSYQHIDVKEFQNEEWQKFAKAEVYKWRNFVLNWLEFKGSMYFLRYETLEKDIMLTIARVLTFLQVPIVDIIPDIICMTKQAQISESFASSINETSDDVFPEDLQQTIKTCRVKVFRAIKKRICLRKETLT